MQIKLLDEDKRVLEKHQNDKYNLAKMDELLGEKEPAKEVFELEHYGRGIYKEHLSERGFEHPTRRDLLAFVSGISCAVRIIESANKFKDMGIFDRKDLDIRGPLATIWALALEEVQELQDKLDKQKDAI